MSNSYQKPKPSQPYDGYIKLKLSPAYIEETEAEFAGFCMLSHLGFSAISRLCAWDPYTKSFFSGFSFPIYNKFFAACAVLWGMDERPEKSVNGLDPESLINFLEDWYGNAELMNNTVLLEDERDKLIRMIQEVWSNISREKLDKRVHHPLFKAWINKRGLFVMEEKSKLLEQTETLTVESLKRMLKEVEQMVPKNTEDESKSPDDLLDEQELSAISLGFEPLRKCIGSYFHQGDSTLIGAAKGGGKTILACQIAALSAFNGYYTVYFTTEESPEQLYPRIISNLLNIPIAQVRNSEVSYRNQPGEIIKERSYGYISEKCFKANEGKIKEITEKLSKYLLFIDWSERSTSGVGEYEAYLDSAQQSLGKPPQLVVFDWVGGALNKSSELDLRLKYNELMEHLTISGRSRNIHTVAFCQLVTSSINKKPTMGDIAESKSLPDSVSNCVLISSYYKREDGNTNEGLFADSQKFVCVKSRKGNPSETSVLRDFTHQRFKCPETPGGNILYAAGDVGTPRSAAPGRTSGNVVRKPAKKSANKLSDTIGSD